MNAVKNSTTLTRQKPETPIACPTCKSLHFTATFVSSQFVLLECAICTDTLLLHVILGGSAELFVMPSPQIGGESC
jgi:hypothetical protein